jgi:signal transduction histidine kinase
VRLRIADDVIGFDPHLAPTDTEGGNGLRVLEHRLTELGGCLTLSARPGQGTAVSIELPDRAEHRG